MKKKEDIKKYIENWVNCNKNQLTVDIGKIKLQVDEKMVIKKITNNKLSFGKYNSLEISSESFYKPLSRIVEI